MKINFQSVLNLSKPSMLKNDTKVNYTPNVAFAPIKDSVSFSARGVREINVDEKTAEIVANSLSTSTSGHRATYGSDLFNKDIVELLTVGVGNYAKNKASERGTIPRVVIGGDTRVASRESLPLIKGILSGIGVDVEYITDPVPTPVLALYTQQRDPDIAILLTASHNPWEDGGYNLVTSDGAIAPPEVTKQVANEVVKAAKKGYYLLKTPENKGQIAHVRPYESYKEKIENLDLIDFDNIQDADIKIYYDDLKGTGASTFEKILRDYEIPYSHVYSGKKTGPNPTSTNLQELKDAVKNDQNRMRIGLSNDGDADRFGVIDENGNFITPNDVILLTAYHLNKNKGLGGDIIRSQATSSQLDLFAKQADLDIVQTPVGFKYIAEDIKNLRNMGGDILVAGEESGGLTIGGHIPEKDGIIVLLLMLDLMASEKKPIGKILKDVKQSLGTEFRAEVISKKLNNDADKERIIQEMKDIFEDAKQGDCAFGSFDIDVKKTQDNLDSMERYRKGGDGIKLYFTDGSSVLVRKSGTEPLVKTYIETYADDADVADNNLQELKNLMDDICTI